MKIALITGSCGLIGSQSVHHFSKKFDLIIGIDNNMRSYFFGSSASIDWNKDELINAYSNYKHYNVDIRNKENIEKIFNEYGDDIKLIIHTAAQPSHDWAAREPYVDFSINALGTLNLLESARQFCYESVFIFTSTNKVYGDHPNSLPLIEHSKRFELDESHHYFQGIDELMTIDQSKHSLFGVSKVAADIMVQEYGIYFGMKTGIFRGGCLTGPLHTGAELHGFLAYLIQCALVKKQYIVYGYKGKQVRDNIHSQDLVDIFDNFYKNPRFGEVYNVGGGRFSNCSILEVFDIINNSLNIKMNWTYDINERSGDHIWWISNMNKFKSHYPNWKQKMNIESIINEIGETLESRLIKK